MEFGHGLRDSDEGQQGSRGHVSVTQLFFALSLELSFFDVSCNDVVVQLGWDRGGEGLGVSDI